MKLLSVMSFLKQLRFQLQATNEETIVSFSSGGEYLWMDGRENGGQDFKNALVVAYRIAANW